MLLQMLTSSELMTGSSLAKLPGPASPPKSIPTDECWSPLPSARAFCSGGINDGCLNLRLNSVARSSPTISFNGNATYALSEKWITFSFSRGRVWIHKKVVELGDVRVLRVEHLCHGSLCAFSPESGVCFKPIYLNSCHINFQFCF